MEEVKGQVEKVVSKASLVDVEMVTPEVVKKAAHQLKSGKSDSSFSFSSDCFRNGFENVYIRLSELFQGFLVHDMLHLAFWSQHSFLWSKTHSQA